MKSERVSHTALKVASLMVTLDKKEGWHERLPEGVAELSKRLILAVDVFGYGPTLMRWAKKGWMVRLNSWGESFMPGCFEGIGHRKIFMNDQVRAAISDGMAQVLVIGAGFETLCLRLAPDFPEVRFFEVDHPATAEAKARGVSQVGRPPNMTMVASDLAETPLSQCMADCDSWDANARSILVAEGLVLYIDRDAVRGLFREAAACTGARSRIAFSHLLSLKEHRIARAMVRVIGEPWLSSSTSEDLPRYIGPGWDVIATAGNALEGFAVAQLE